MQWYDWHTVTERLQGRAYALTRGRAYRVILDPKTSTGCCDFTSKRILINPNLFSDILEKMGISGSKLDKANFLISRAITGHESLHVLYSDPKVVLEAAEESLLLKTVLNILEDARVEKIGSETSHVSKTLFSFVNGIARTQLPEFTDTSLTDPSSFLNLLLRWRLGAGIPILEQPAEQLWRRVLTLANAALYAADCAQVLLSAREIIKIAGLDKRLSEDQTVDDLIEKMQSDMTGSRDSSVMPNPLGSDNQVGTVSPENETESPDESTSEEEYPNEEVAEEPGKDVDKDPRNADDDAASDQEDNDSGQSGVSEEEKLDTGSGNQTDSQESAGDLVHSLHSSDNDCAAESGDGSYEDSPDDIEKLIEDTATQVSEELDSLVPQDSGDNSLVAKATAWRGRVYSDVIASPYAHYLPEAAPIAAELIRDLKADGPKAVSGPSESPGRFKTRYYIRDHEKPFSAQKYQGLTVPKMALSLIIDRSGSMEDIAVELRTMSMAITMACENLQIPVSIWALEGQVHVKRFEEHGPQVLAKIAGVQTDTLTRVMPTIRDAVDDLKTRPEELKQIVLIHDGMPSDRIDFINWRTELKGIGIFCLFIMKEEDYQIYKDNPVDLRQRMDELVGPQHYAIAPVSELARHWCSFIRNIRRRYSQVVL